MLLCRSEMSSFENVQKHEKRSPEAALVEEFILSIYYLKFDRAKWTNYRIYFSLRMSRLQEIDAPKGLDKIWV